MGESMIPEVHVCADLNEASLALAENLVNIAQDSVLKRGFFSLALSGGKTPRTLYGLLASEYSSKIPWDGVHLFWSDERCVPKDHTDSNYGMAYNILISKVSLPSKNIHRIPAEIDPPEKAAASYERVLRDFFKSSEGEVSPTFDVSLLGVGEDGHTASLFPGESALEEKNCWAVAVKAPPPFSPQNRITLTFPVINGSDTVFFLASGSEKSKILKSILEEPDKSAKIYPSALVHPKARLTWFVDREIQIKGDYHE